MMNNIKEEFTRKVIEEELLLDNALLQCVQKENNVEIVIRFVESFNKIKEFTLGFIAFEEYLMNRQNYIEINKNSNTIAFFKKENENFILDKLYNYETHESLGPSFIDLHYKEATNYKKIKENRIIPEYD